MPTSDSRSSDKNSRKQRHSGFTLIEILVVLLIVTVLVSVTIPNLPGFVDHADYDVEARRLELLLNMARTEAVLDSVELGFGPTDEGYQFYRYDDVTQTWRPGLSPYQPRKLPEDLTLQVRTRTSDFALEGKNLPAVLILSSGESTPVELLLQTRGDYHKTLETDGYGPFEWQADD